MNVYDPHMHIKEVILVGTGGTGAQIARCIARLAYDMGRARLHVPAICFIDPDTVDEGNIGRQLFSYGDLENNKARVLAARFNAALGLNISAIDQPFDAERHVKHASSTLLIGAVDNELARRELARAHGALWLDTGNHRQAGQAILGDVGDLDLMLQHIDGKDGVYTHLPNAALLFPQLLEPETSSESGQEMRDAGLSCAGLVALGEQGLFVNDLVAAIAAQYIWRILYRQPIHTFASFVDGDTLCARSLPVCREELLSYLER
ncbi:MAG: PRTRC system ThiF family protein [Anaerolineae bacterium]|nr:PRTRC system ThiF family protein [Anaerolineae bacterium]